MFIIPGLSTLRVTFPGYMSPEILIGDEFGIETDVFSLGRSQSGIKLVSPSI